MIDACALRYFHDKLDSPNFLQSTTELEND